MVAVAVMAFIAGMAGGFFDLEIAAPDMSTKTVGAKTDEGWNLWSNGYLGEWLKFHKKGKYTITIKARGDKALDIWPIMDLGVDGKAVKRWNVESASFKTYTAEIEIDEGAHQVLVAFRNDHFERGQDRNLHVASITVKPAAGIKDPEVTKEPDWLKEADKRIEKIRKGDLTVRVVDSKGKPVPGAKVTIEQTRHEFRFGTCINARLFGPRGDNESGKKYRNILKEYFNCAVFENAFKWPQFEPLQDKPDYSRVDAALDWCTKQNIPVRGHCIFWANEKRVPAWARALDNDRLRKAIETRITRDLKRYKGKILEYDVNNEMIANNYFAKRLGEAIRPDMFKLAKKADPGAKLFVNDYNILNGSFLDRYEKQIEGLLKAGAPVDGIGCQGHFGGQISSPLLVKMRLDRLAKFKLPILVTEFDINTKDEKAKAKQLADFYRVCFSHPSVDGILMWGFWAGSHWRPDAALFDRDFSPRPVAKAYKDLVFGEWWSQCEGKTNDKGEVSARAFYGSYKVTVAAPDGSKPDMSFRFTQSTKDKAIVFTLK